MAATGTVLNIEDAYRIPSDREYGFNVEFDKSTGYRSKSMLTVPMQDHKGEILGVIQLINRKADNAQRLGTPEEVEEFAVPFSSDIEPLVMSLASQAAVSLENNLLYEEIETLFEGFVKASVQAIESRIRQLLVIPTGSQSTRSASRRRWITWTVVCTPACTSPPST